MNAESIDRTDNEYNLCLQGSSLDVGNLGCHALTASLIKLVTDCKPNARIYLLYGNRTNGVQSLEVSGRTVKVNIVNFRLSPRASISEHLFWILFLALLQWVTPIKLLRERIIQSNRWLRTLHYADFVGEIRGGDSFSDIYGLRTFVIGISPCIIAILMQKDLVLLPQTYGPFESTIAERIARFIMMRATQLLSRDRDSIEVIHEILGTKGKNKDILFCPDVAFVLDSAKPKEMDISPTLVQSSCTPLIGLNISSLLYIGGFTHDNMFDLKVDYKEFVNILLRALMEQTNADVLLVPHVFWSDSEWDEIQVCREVSELVERKHRKRIHLVMRPYDQNQTKGIIGLCDFFIGSRMHACIAALSQGIPTVGLAYSKKFRGVFQTIGAERYVMDMRQKGPEEIIETIMNSFEQRNSIAENLKATIPEAQKQIRDIFEQILRG